MQLNARCEQPSQKTHTTPSCVLQAIKWWLYSQVVGVQQRGTIMVTTAYSIPGSWLPNRPSLSLSLIGRLSYLHLKMCDRRWWLELLERLSLQLFLATPPFSTSWLPLDYLATDEEEINDSREQFFYGQVCHKLVSSRIVSLGVVEGRWVGGDGIVCSLLGGPRLLGSRWWSIHGVAVLHPSGVSTWPGLEGICIRKMR